MNDIINKKIDSLSRSDFRSKFKLRDKDIKYVNDKGINKIREHAYDFNNKRLTSKEILNDGKQTPMRGHPVFIAQHSTATCCGKCLYKWHRISVNKDLNKKEIDYVVSVVMEWIKRKINK